MNIGARLKQWREGKHLKQDEASFLLRIPFSIYQKYEMGNRKPGTDAMEAFSLAGINVNWLLTGKGEMLQGLHSAKEEPNGYFARPLMLGVVKEDLQIAIEVIEEQLLNCDSYMDPPDKAKCIIMAYEILQEEDEKKDKAAYEHARKILQKAVTVFTKPPEKIEKTE